MGFRLCRWHLSNIEDDKTAAQFAAPDRRASRILRETGTFSRDRTSKGFPAQDMKEFIAVLRQRGHTTASVRPRKVRCL